MGLSSLKAALLDFDGTLVHLPVDWQRLREQIAALFAAHGYHSGFRPLYTEVANAFAALEARSVPAPVRAALRRRLNRLMTEAELGCVANVSPMPGARELMQELRRRGWKLIIQSSNSVHCIREVLDRLSLPAVDAIVGRETARYAKPDPAGVRHALRTLGLRAQDTLVIGDGDYDIELGRALGATTIRIGAGTGADREVASLADVIALLDPERALQEMTA